MIPLPCYFYWHGYRYVYDLLAFIRECNRIGKENDFLNPKICKNEYVVQKELNKKTKRTINVTIINWNV